jgi:Flp pilus assembly pilin Flp
MRQHFVSPDLVNIGTIRAVIARFHRCDSGATSIEYGVIAALAALAAIPALQTTGGKLSGSFGAVAAALDGKGPPSAAASSAGR